MCVNITVYKGNSPIQRLLKEQLKNGLHILKNLINLLVNLLFSLFSSNKLDVILEIAKNDAFKNLKDGLKESLNSLVNGSLSELWKLIKGKIGNNNVNMISSWPEYLLKGAKVCNNISEAETLTSLLAENGVLSIDGELNNEEISENNKTKNKNKKIKLNLGIENLLKRKITKKL